MTRATIQTSGAGIPVDGPSIPLSRRIEASASRARVAGKFICVGDDKLLIKGVTYGPFRPTNDGSEYHDPETVSRDFELMARHGVNSVRLYTVPPTWLLDIAQANALRVLVGLPWEQHVAFLDSRETSSRIERTVRSSVASLAGHAALLGYTIGNEIPAPIARWHGRRPIQKFLERLSLACKREDAGALVTYANYPSTEYLDLPFLDFVSFNVYLETQEKLAAYLARLHNIAGDRPLVVAELGLDSLHHGADKQAQVIDWQVRTTFCNGCAGAFVFSWTDEWFRGGQDIDGWQFGLTTRDRQPKPSFNTLSNSLREVPFSAQTRWPRVSLIVCTHNGGKTLEKCLAGVHRLDYPNLEIIVVDDGSTDNSADIARRFPVNLISGPNRGLSSARNTGLHSATGEIVAYIDDDAWPDPQWMQYIATVFLTTDHVGVGGPNISPGDDSFRSQCVARAPGGPMHVLLTDTVAEHLPGCNMAFRRQALLDIGGFDEQFRIAGDDVDVCWRLQERGWTLGFSPAAMVWHQRRKSLRAYWKQQLNYGRAEAMLERKWPNKYNALGNPTWEGRLYGKGLLRSLTASPGRIYHGRWGSALFQSIYHTTPGVFCSLPTTPEWYLILLILAASSAWGIVWTPLVAALPLLIVVAGITAAQAMLAVGRAYSRVQVCGRWELLRLRLVTAWLHMLQPAARLSGRFRTGLTPWRRRGPRGIAMPISHKRQFWCRKWQSLDQTLSDIESQLKQVDAVVVHGGDFDNWDLEVRGGITGSVRLRATVEEHGDGNQMFRLLIWPRLARGPALLTLFTIVVWDAAALTGAWETWIVSGLALLLLGWILLREIGGAMAAVLHATSAWKAEGGRR